MRSSATQYTRRCSWFRRRDHAPTTRCFSRSGFPIPEKGSLKTASTRSSTRSAVLLSCCTQCFRSSRNSGWNTATRLPLGKAEFRRNSPTVEGGSACSWARRRARRSRRAFAGERMRCAVSVSDASSSALIRATSSPPGRRMSTGCRVEATSSHSAANVMRASSQVVTCVARIKPSSVPNTAGLHHGVVRRPCPATRNPSSETVRERRKDGHASTRRRSGVISIVAPPSIHTLHCGRRHDRAVSSIRDAVLRIAYTALEAGGRHG